MARLLRHRPAPRFLGAWADPPRAPRGVAIPPESILWHVRPRSDSASGGVVRVGPEGRGDEADTLEPGAEVQPLVGKEGVRQLGAGRQLARAWQRESERTLIVRPLQRAAAGRDGKPVVGTKPVVDKVDASAGSAAGWGGRERARQSRFEAQLPAHLGASRSEAQACGPPCHRRRGHSSGGRDRARGMHACVMRDATREDPR